MSELVVECAQVIDRPPEHVWRAIREMASRPAVHADPSHDAPIGPVLRMDELVAMEQRVVQADDDLMVVRTEMAGHDDAAWSTFESVVRVQPTGAGTSKVSMTCLVRALGNPGTVEGMFRGYLLLSILALKARVEREAPGAAPPGTPPARASPTPSGADGAVRG